MGESHSTLCWVKEARHKEYMLDRDTHFQNTNDRTQNVVSHGREYSYWKDTQRVFKGWDDFLFWIWFLITWPCLLWEYWWSYTMMIHIYFNKGREKTLQRKFYSHNKKKNFFSVKEWERSTEIAHLSFTSLKGIFNNLENTPWNFGIFKKSKPKDYGPFHSFYN